jgi:hypothetical protein
MLAQASGVGWRAEQARYAEKRESPTLRAGRRRKPGEVQAVLKSTTQ